NCECRLKRFTASNLIADNVAFEASWHSPRLAVTNVEVQLYDGSIEAQTDLDVSNRAFHLTISANFDPKNLRPIFPAGAQQSLDQFSWQKPPLVNGDISLVLPAWTNQQPDYGSEVLPTLSVNGLVDFEQGFVYQQKLQVSSIRSHVIYSNLSWDLPDLFLRRPEGSLAAEHRDNGRTRDFYWHIASTIDLKVVRPLLRPEEQEVLDLFTLTQPPAIDAEIWGRYHDQERTKFKG